MSSFWLRISTLSISGLVLLAGLSLVVGYTLPARLLSYPHGDIPRATYFIHLIDIGRGLEAPYSDLAIGYCCLNWSPDGRYLMALTPALDHAPGRYELTLIDHQTRQVIWNSGNIGYTSGVTAWSPDSRHLLYDSNARGDGDQAIHMLTVDGDQFTTAPLLPESVSNNQIANARAWSADGRWIVYGIRQIQTPIYQLYEVATGQSISIPQGELLREPTFGPQGSQIAFNRGTLTETQLVLTDVDCLLHDQCSQSEQRVTLVPLASLQTWPTWSPDGNRVAYSLGFGAASGIYQAQAAPTESRSRMVIDRPGDEWFLNWSFDGLDIAYLSNESGTDELYRVQVNTGEAQRLTRNNHVDGPPVWVPSPSSQVTVLSSQ